MNKISVIFLTASLSLATAGTLTIDNFSIDQGPGNLSESGSSGPVDIGGGITRTLALTSLGGIAPVAHGLQVAGGVLDITNGVADNSSVLVTYTLPLLGVPGGASNLYLDLTIVGSDGNPTNVSVGGLGSGSFAIPGNTNNAPLSFAVAGPPFGPGTLTLTFTGAPGWDLSIDSLGLSWTDPAPVPEPATYGMIAIGLVGFYMARRRS